MISFDVTQRKKNPRYQSISPQRFKNLEKLFSKRNFIKDNKRHQILFQPQILPIRRVPAFTIQVQQYNTKPYTPITENTLYCKKRPELGRFSKSAPPSRDENLQKFLLLYEDRKFPIRVISNGTQMQRQLEWQIDPNLLNEFDKQELFRRFSVGLSVEKEPYAFIALQGFKNLLNTTNASRMVARSLIDVIPNIRQGLNCKKLTKKLEILEILCQIAKMPEIGPLLLPYYRMLLPPLRIVKGTQISTDISISDRDRLFHAIQKTLRCLEQTGGENAYANIKFIIPEY